MSHISPQAQMLRQLLTRHLRACGIKKRIKVRTDVHVVRCSNGARYREYGDASTDTLWLPEGLDLKAVVAEKDVTAYLMPTADPARPPLFWLSSEWAKGGRVVTISGSLARPTFTEEGS